MTTTSAMAIFAAAFCAMLPLHASAQEKTPAPKAATPSVLFVQTAGSFTFADGVLTLKDVAPMTVFFTDRPKRLTGHIGNEGFVKGWGQGQNSFKSDPPNAALSTLGTGGRPSQAVVVLTNPSVDGKAISYQAKVMEGNLSAQGSESTLFIDGADSPCNPGDQFAYSNVPCWAQDAFSHGR
jgi:hypothetical protein